MADGEALSLDNKRLLLHDQESIAAAIHQLGTKIDELNSTIAQLNVKHGQDIAKLKSEHAQEVADLKAGLNAEKLERCRTGSVTFHHAECATHQCTESQVIHFTPPFTKVPVVTYAFAYLDVNGDHNLRIGAGDSSVTTSSATLRVETWSNTVIYGSIVKWIACPGF